MKLISLQSLISLSYFEEILDFTDEDKWCNPQNKGQSKTAHMFKLEQFKKYNFSFENPQKTFFINQIFQERFTNTLSPESVKSKLTLLVIIWRQIDLCYGLDDEQKCLEKYFQALIPFFPEFAISIFSNEKKIIQELKK